MSEQPSKSTKNGSRVGSGLVVFLGLIVVGVIVYLAYELYRRGEGEAVLIEKLVEVERNLNFKARQIDELKQRLDKSELIDHAVVDARFSEFGQRLEVDLEAIRRQLNTSPEDWLFAEVEYLVRMANQRVLMEKDVTSALELLISADRIVRDAEGLMAHDLRQALANDVAALRAVVGPDVQGIYLELSALISQVPNLQRELPEFEIVSPPTEEIPPSASMLERSIQLVVQAVRQLSTLVDFRRGDTGVKPILPPEQLYYLRQNLILKLQIAQKALLEGEGEVYQISLNEAGDWLSISFDNDATRQAMIDSLLHLAALQISGELPDISASLEAARTMLADFNEDSRE